MDLMSIRRAKSEKAPDKQPALDAALAVTGLRPDSKDRVLTQTKNSAEDPPPRGEVSVTGESQGGPDGGSSQRATTDRRNHPPTSQEGVKALASQLFGRVWRLRERHGVLAGRWATLDTWGRLVLAITASLSAVSLLADRPVVTGFFAVLTAVFSALSATLVPGPRATRHRKAAGEFFRLEIGLTELLTEVSANHRSPSPGQLRAQGEAVADFESAVEEAQDRAPLANPMIGQDADRTPLTNYGVKRLKKRLVRENEVYRLRRKFDNPYDVPYGDNDPGSGK